MFCVIHSFALIIHIGRRVDVERATDSSPDGVQPGSSFPGERSSFPGETREAIKTIHQLSTDSSPPTFALEEKSTVLRKRAVGKRVAGRYVDLGQFSDDE
jgi:hypothetical protein